MILAALSSVEASLCRGGWGGWGEGQKKARGALMRGTPFASSQRHPRVSYSWIITICYWDTQ